MKKILITGAGGFIGGFMVEKALKEGFATWAGVRNTTSRIYLQDERIRFIDLPFHNPKQLKQTLAELKEQGEEWDVIIHNLGVTKCIRTEEFEKINYQFTRNFAEALQQTGMVPGQFILMSSLGALGPGDETGMTPIRAQDPPTPNTAYGRSKLKAEQFLKSLPDFPWVIMRPTGVYGPREKDYFLMVKTIQAGFDFGAGYKPQQITFIYVKDLVDCVFQAIKKKVVCREYIVSEEKAYTSSDFRRYAQKALHKKIVIPVTVPLFVLKTISVIAEQFGRITGKSSTLNRDKYHIMKQRNWVCDITPLKEELDFKINYPLEKGVKETIAWYKENGWL
ncbi:MAG: NAD(P)-dependent oxidoreductase [Bacteroidales bacterium]